MSPASPIAVAQSNLTSDLAANLRLDDYFQGFCLCGLSEGLISVKNFGELEAVRIQDLRVYLVRQHGLEQHRYGGRVDHPRRD